MNLKGLKENPDSKLISNVSDGEKCHGEKYTRVRGTENMEQIGHCYAVLCRTARELLFEEVVFDWRKSMGSKR